MRIALISDIHSNLEALHAVLQNINKKDIDKIVGLGDIVGYGANPNEVIKLLQEIKADCIQGNHDLHAVTLSKLDWFNQWAREALLWTNKQLTAENKEWLMKLPLSFEITHGKNKLYAVHGSPRDELYEYIYPTTDEETIREFFVQKKATVIAAGHTHLPDLKRIGANLFINPGSVGQPRNNDTRASYAIIDLEDINFVSIEKIDYDIDTATKKIIKAGLPRYLAERLHLGR